MGEMRTRKRAERGTMTLDLDHGGLVIRFPPGMTAELSVLGSLQAQFGLGSPQGPEDLRDEIRQARAAKGACQLMRYALDDLTKNREDLERKPDGNIKHGKKGEAFAAGLEAGLLGQHRVLGGGTHMGLREAASVVEPQHPLNGNVYRRGWELGCAIFAALELAAGRPDPRQLWGRQTEADRLWEEARESSTR